MKRIWLLFGAHVAALAFGLGGILIALPNPHLWAGSEWGADVFEFGMSYGGSLHIVLGALTMLLFGGMVIGWRRTGIFFVVTVVLSLSSELIGTGTGWPFGNYEYTSGLGYKVLGRVPFTIPLSWFYIGFASYLLGNTLIAQKNLRWRAPLTVLFGGYLLTVWDLVLDPAMAHEDLPIRFWTWFETGAYFGMPVKNFGGWILTGILFMGISRVLWRDDPAPARYRTELPFLIYLVNIIFAIALSLSVDLWGPALLSIVFGVIPAAIAWRSQPPGAGQPSLRANARVAGPSAAEPFAFHTIRAGASFISRRKMNLTIEGADRIPDSGPVVLACHHYHHLYDGCALMQATERRVRILVALDWVNKPLLRRLMEAACRMVRWPVIVRQDAIEHQPGGSAYTTGEARKYLRNATRETVELLKSGECVVMFPEGFPVVDPSHTPKGGETEFLPFRSGFARLAQRASRATGAPVPVLPVGFNYEPTGKGWNVTMRVGPVVYVDGSSDIEAVTKAVDERVQRLSIQPSPVKAGAAREVIPS